MQSRRIYPADTGFMSLENAIVYYSTDGKIQKGWKLYNTKNIGYMNFEPTIFRLMQELLNARMLIYTHALNRGGKGVKSPADDL